MKARCTPMPEPLNPHMKVDTPSFRVLGVRVHAIQIPGTIAQMEEWIESSRIRPLCRGHRNARRHRSA